MGALVPMHNLGGSDVTTAISTLILGHVIDIAHAIRPALCARRV